MRGLNRNKFKEKKRKNIAEETQDAIFDMEASQITESVMTLSIWFQSLREDHMPIGVKLAKHFPTNASCVILAGFYYVQWSEKYLQAMV